MFKAAARRESSRFRSCALASSGLLLSMLPAAAAAHEFWIQPERFRVAPGTVVALQLLVGEHFKGDSLIYLPELFERYVHVGPRGETSITAVPGDDPAGRVTLREPGVHIIAYRSTHSSVTFDTLSEFERYLDKEGIEHARKLPGYAARTRLPIHERYSRCAKALITVGAPGGKAKGDRPLGLRLELVAEKNPHVAGHGERLPVRLLLDGKPLAGALVKAFHKDDPMNPIQLRTAADGRVLLPLARPGMWLLNAVHIAPAPADAKAAWESLWASLTFELGPG